MKNTFPLLRKIGSEISELNEVPLFGTAPPFDWDRFSSLLASHFGISNLSLRPLNQEWNMPHQLLDGLGKNGVVFPIHLSALNGVVYWIMPPGDMGKLTSWMLNKKPRGRALTSEILQEGFYRYLLLEALDAVQNIEPLTQFTLTLHEEAPLPEERAFCVDVEMSFNESSCVGRLVIPYTLRQSWVEHFSRSSPGKKAFNPHLELTLGIKVGSVELRPTDWEGLKKGDFLVLDTGSYDFEEKTAMASLVLGETPLFHVTVKHNQIELLEPAFLYEDPTAMERNHSAHDEWKNSDESAIDLQSLPLQVTVELARVKMTLEKLSALSPGNFLELPISPEAPVSLTINGQKVGQGELVYLGDTLGVRILELG